MLKIFSRMFLFLVIIVGVGCVNTNRDVKAHELGIQRPTKRLLLFHFDLPDKCFII